MISSLAPAMPAANGGRQVGQQICASGGRVSAAVGDGGDIAQGTDLCRARRRRAEQRQDQHEIGLASQRWAPGFSSFTRVVRAARRHSGHAVEAIGNVLAKPVGPAEAALQLACPRAMTPQLRDAGGMLPWALPSRRNRSASRSDYRAGSALPHSRADHRSVIPVRLIFHANSAIYPAVTGAGDCFQY